MTFDELIKLVSEKNDAIDVCIDSRNVTTGSVFIAIDGVTAKGSDYIDHALSNGASYIVCQKDHLVNLNCQTIFVEDPTKAAGLLAQAAMGYPASKLTNLAVTGTNGKTTVAYLVRSIIQTAGKKCGLIGTVVYDTGDQQIPANLTTPDSITIAKIQKQMAGAKTKYMITEASSHSLAQNRLAGINFKAAAFTNLTGDHLDYHKTEKDYLKAKSRLFEDLAPDATAILNKQSPHSLEIAERTNAKILFYAIDEPADLTAEIISMDITATTLRLKYAKQSSQIQTTLLGKFNVSNILAAAGLSLAAGFDLETIAAGLAQLTCIPGRLEKINSNGDFSVLVDYAHTDDALKNVLSTLRPLCKGKLKVLFGCGGDRDKTKRPRMARIAEQLADDVIVTSDNPRTEKDTDIIDDIVTGFEYPNSPTIAIEPDRKKAIQLAIKTAKKNDTVLIAGKGHEDYQIIGTQKFDFSDKETALQFLKT
ncbi:MAG: UDP-N-acetylmuramoyl-L-alanyl-D-glutamate--2,6-diaminopimelate ligase [Planctomycetota bacterium]|jgi:UDP-N-acetylmuramoyl-L-alanyl-D-glutamate--2,6-diaminopimelate ligase